MRTLPLSLLLFLVSCGGGSGGSALLGIAIERVVVAGEPVAVRLSSASGTLAFESSDPNAILPRTDSLVVEFRTAGEQTLTVRSSSGAEASVRIDVRPGAVARFDFSVSDPQPIGKGVSLAGEARMRAVDAYGNVRTDFAAPVRIRATGATVRGLDGVNGDEVLTMLAGQADLAGRLILDAAIAPDDIRLIAESDSGLTGVSASFTLRPPGPQLLRYAQYRDRFQTRAVDAGDEIVLTFDEPVDPAIAEPSPLGAVTAGPDEDQVTITLDSGVSLPAEISIPAAGRAEIHAFPVDGGVRLGPLSRSEDVEIVDLDRDGDLDLVFANNVDSEYFLSDGAGGYTRYRLASTPAGTSVDSADFDGDGWRDLVVGTYTNARIYKNDRNGGFTPTPALPAGNLVTDVETGDLDGDGDPDLVVATRGSNSVWINDGAGAFTQSQSFDSYYTEDIVLTDIDGDGDLDSIHANVVLVNMLEPNAPNRIWLNDGTGRFSLKAEFGPLDRTWSIAAGDLDNDGDVDIVTGEREGNRVWLNDGAGNLSLLAVLDYGKFTFGLVLDDLDSDGDLDLISTRRVWLNDGTGRMTTLGRWVPIPRQRTGVAAADLDGDGDLDVVIAHTAWNGTTGNEPSVIHFGSATR